MAMQTNWLQIEPIDDEEEMPHMNTLTSCMTLCDVKCDNYIRLVAAEIYLEDEPMAKLKVFRGIKLVEEQILNGIPAAIESLYIDESDPKTPIIAVAISESILFFRQLKPYFKYILPGVETEEAEKEIWLKLLSVRVEHQAGVVENLKTIEHSKLSRKSQKLLQLPAEDYNAFINEHAESPLMLYANIVAMQCLQRVSSEANPPSHLVIATDIGDILILEPQGFSILHQAKTCSFETTPSLMAVHGTYETDFRIVIATRYGAIYLLRKSATEGQEVFKMSQALTGLLLLPVDQTIIVSSVDKRLICYSKKGKQLYSAMLATMPVCMIPITLENLGITLICVALEGGLVQFYMQKFLVDEFQLNCTISAMIFGRMGWEDHVLTLITTEGDMIVKILKRTATFEPSNNLALKSLVQQQHSVVDASILDKPKKSSIFVEQTNREKHNAKATYGNFQVELWRLRHSAARATVDAINSSESTISGDITHAPVKLSAEVCGAGPAFRVYLNIQNLSTYKMASNLMILLHADRRHYTIAKSTAKLPSILPGIPLRIDLEVIAVLDHMDKLPPHTLTPENSHIRIMLLKAQQTKPLIAAVIAMPQSEANF